MAERARQAVDEIAAVLVSQATQPEDESGELLPGPSLGGGACGGALFLAYRVQAGAGSAADADAAAALLERSTAALATTPLTPDLYGGFAGVAWTAEHLYGPRFAPAEDAEGGAGNASTPAAGG